MWYDGFVLIPDSTPTEQLETTVAAMMDPYYAELRVSPYKRYLGKAVVPDWDEFEAMRRHYGLPPDAQLTDLIPFVRNWAGCPADFAPGVDDGGLYTWSDLNPIGEWDTWRITEVLPDEYADIDWDAYWMVLTPNGIWHGVSESDFVIEGEAARVRAEWNAKAADLLTQHSYCLAVGVTYHW